MERGRYPTLRRLLSIVFAAVNRLLFRLPIRETQTGLKAFRRQTLEPALQAMETVGYAFDLELLVRIHKAGGSMSTSPVTLAHGAAGHVSIMALIRIGWDTLRIWVRSPGWP